MKKILYIFAVQILIIFGTNAQSISKATLKKLDKEFAKMVKGWDTPGASIGIVKDGKLVFTGNYGVLEIGKEQKPNKNTLFAIASNTKAFTTAMIGILVQKGKLKWDDKVKKYLPYFALGDIWVSNHVTIRDLLCHRVGLGTFSGDNLWYKSSHSSEEIIKRIKHVPIAFEFRSGFGYSNLMYITAGEVIKAVTGQTFAENVREHILKPLEMNRTIFSTNDLQKMGNYATPHGRKDNKNIKIPWVNWDNVTPTGGMISSVEDLSKWMILNINNGIYKQDTLLTNNTRNTVWKPHNNYTVDHTKPNDYNMHFNSYGLGWLLSDYHGRLKVSHTGGYDGMISALTLVPDEKLGVVILTNGLKAPIRAATNYALDTILETSTIDWSKKLLDSSNKSEKNDTRITDRKAKRKLNTSPIIEADKFVGDYMSDLYGGISIIKKGDKLKLEFEYSPLLSATLTHWHYDVWEIHWDNPQAWFSFGTVKIKTDNNLNVTGIDFDVPNDDFYFYELKPYRVMK